MRWPKIESVFHQKISFIVLPVWSNKMRPSAAAMELQLPELEKSVFEADKTFMGSKKPVAHTRLARNFALNVNAIQRDPVVKRKLSDTRNWKERAGKIPSHLMDQGNSGRSN